MKRIVGFFVFLVLINLFFPGFGAETPTEIRTFFSGINSHDLMIDRSGNLWVANADVNTITKLNPSGSIDEVIPNIPTTVGLYDTRNLMIQDVNGSIDVLTDNGTIVVLDENGNRVGGSYIPNVNRVIDFAMDASGSLWAAGYWSVDNTCSYTVPQYESYYDRDEKKWKSRHVCDRTYTYACPSYGENITLLDPGAMVKGQLHFDAHGDFPAQMAADGSGNIWVTQHQRNIIIKLDPFGTTIGKYDVGSSSEGIALDPSGNVWVGTDAHEIVKLSPTGQILNRTHLDTRDWKFGPDRVVADQAGYVWVANPMNGVVELDPSGRIVASYPMPNPVALAIDAQRNVWVVNNQSGGNNLWEIPQTAMGAQYSPVSKTQSQAAQNEDP